MVHPDYVGCDVSKHYLDLFTARDGLGFRIANSAQAIAATVARLQGGVVVLEATGAYDRGLREILSERGVGFVRVNPHKARDFARAAGFLAKTDRLDAKMLAAMGRALKLEPGAGVDLERERLARLVKRRDQLVAMRAQERTRLRDTLDADLRNDLATHIEDMSQRVRQLERTIAKVSAAKADVAAACARLSTAPGVGAVTASVLVALLPELGTRSPKQIAALAGLAPMACDSGLWRGQRHIRGGRRRVRQALYIAAVAAIRTDTWLARFYRRLRAAGKAAKPALVATARKLLIALNAMLRDNVDFARA